MAGVTAPPDRHGLLSAAGAGAVGGPDATCGSARDRVRAAAVIPCPAGGDPTPDGDCDADVAPGRAIREHAPASPVGAAVEAWAVSTRPCEVAGEWFHQDAFRALYKRRGATITEYGQELRDLAAELAIDPSNPHDPNAVGVWVSGRMLGFLPRLTAAEYTAALADLAEEGAHLSVPARVWARADDDGQIAASATVWLPPVHGVQPFNAFPEAPFQVLPAGRAVQVTGEDEHMDVLRPFVSDRERYLVVTLHLVQEARTPRSTPFEAIEVRLGGRRVGTLTKAMSGQLRDLVAHVDGLGRLPACRARLRGSPLRAELTLYVARSADVTSRWLDSIATA